MKALRKMLAFVLVLTFAVVAPASYVNAKNKVKVIDKTVYLYTKTRLPYFDGYGEEEDYSYSVSGAKYIKVTNEAEEYYSVSPLVVGQKLTKGHTKPVITIYRNKKGEAKQVYRKYRFTVKKTPKITQKLSVNKNALKLTKLKDIFSKDLVYKYSDKSVAKITYDSVFSGHIYEEWRYNIGVEGYCVKGLKYGKTKVKAYIKGTKTKVAEFDITVKRIKPSIKKKYRTVTLWYSKYGWVKKGEFCLESIINNLSIKSKLSLKIADKKKAYYFEGSPDEFADITLTQIRAKKLGKTKAVVYETLNGKKRKVGTVNIVIKKAKMADAAWYSPYDEEGIDVPDELYPGDICNVRVAIENYWLTNFAKKDYTITYKAKYPKIASVSKNGILKVLKPAVTSKSINLVNYTIKFSDGSKLSNGIWFYVMNSVTDKSSKYEYELNKDNTVNILKYKGSKTKLTLPEKLEGYKVTGLNENAFPNEMTEITIPVTLTKISPSAFNFTQISKFNVIEGNPRFTASEDGILYNKSKTTLFRFPPMKKLKSFNVPDGVKTIGSHAFFECQVKSVNLPSTVKKIGNCAFASEHSKSGTDTVYLDNGDDKEYISTHGLINSVTLPKGLEEIGNCAFEKSSIKSISLPKTLKKMGYKAFRSTALTSVKIPAGIKELDQTFEDCKKLSKVTLSYGLKKIGSGAFWNCPIEYLKMPDSVTTIEDSSLDGAKKVRLSANLKKISKWGAFGTSLKKISVSKKNKYFSVLKNVLYNKKRTKLITYPAGINNSSYTTPKTVKEIISYAFDNVKIKSLTITGNVKTIKSFSFSKCKINKLRIKNGVKKIEEEAFDECKIKGKVVIPDSVKKFKLYAFDECVLQSFKVPKCLKTIGEHEFFDTDIQSEIIIPPYVKSIHKDAFGDMSYYYGKKPIIKGKKGSAAEKYAKANKLKFKAIK